MNSIILLLSSVLLIACTVSTTLPNQDNATIVPSILNNTAMNVTDSASQLQQQTLTQTFTLFNTDSITYSNITIEFIELTNHALFQIQNKQFFLILNQSISIDNSTITLLSIEPNSLTQPRMSFVDLSARVFGVGGIRDTLVSGENYSLTIGNQSYNLSVIFIGLDSLNKDSVLLSVNGQSRTLLRREDSAIGGLYVFIHEIYRVRQESTITRSKATIKIETSNQD